MTTELERVIRELTQPLNGQYPRPWMTGLSDPASAEVFIVGKNQAKGYPVEAVGPRDRYLDALFNRNGLTCRGLYDAITGSAPSPTRRNIDALTARLERRGVTRVLETNVICYSTPMSSDLGLAQHVGGRERGQEIFRALLALIRPRVLIAHGADTIRKLERIVGMALPAPPSRPDDPVIARSEAQTVIVLPSLAPPAYNKWSSVAAAHLDRVAGVVAAELAA